LAQAVCVGGRAPHVVKVVDSIAYAMCAARSFQPPSWCRAPRDPQTQKFQVCFGSSESVVDIYDKAVYTIGRGDTTDIQLRGDLGSRMHAALLQDVDGQKFLVDLKSTHGTFVDGRRLAPHQPSRLQPGVQVSFGSGAAVETAVLAGAGLRESPLAKRAKMSNDESGSEDAAPKPALASAIGGFSLYDDLPEATTVECAPKAEERKIEEVIVPVEDPTKIIFLDVDGVLRALHGRTDFLKHTKTIEINGQRVPLVGGSTDMAGIDFWPTAMRSLRHVVAKTGARIVLSSDWRKDEVLKQGVCNQLEEYRIPPLYGCTPDLDKASAGVVKALHSSFREKRCKEIRRWTRAHPTVTCWVAIDDIDLSMPDKEAKIQEMISGKADEASVFLDPMENFVRCNPTEGLNMERAKLAIALLNGVHVTEQDLDRAYGTAQAGDT